MNDSVISSERLLQLEKDAALWNKHKDVFRQMERMLNEARPLVNTFLKVQEAAEDAR